MCCSAQVPAGEDKNIHVLFAGGIHDATSAAMVRGDDRAARARAA